MLRTHECDKEAGDLISFLIDRIDTFRGAAAVTLTHKEFKILRGLILMYDQAVKLGEYNLNYLEEAKKVLENTSHREMSILHIWEYRLYLFVDQFKELNSARFVVLECLCLIDEILERPSLREQVEKDENLCEEITQLFRALYAGWGRSTSEVYTTRKTLESLEMRLRGFK